VKIIRCKQTHIPISVASVLLRERQRRKEVFGKAFVPGALQPDERFVVLIELQPVARAKNPELSR